MPDFSLDQAKPLENLCIQGGLIGVN